MARETEPKAVEIKKPRNLDFEKANEFLKRLFEDEDCQRWLKEMAKR